jgi:hypothetical protein
MKNEKVYLWSDLPWDIAIAQGMKLDSLFNDLDAIKDKDSDEWLLEAERLEATANTAIGEKLWLDIYNGKLLVRKANGDPLDGEPKTFSIRGVNAPHLTRDEGNKWLSENRYLQSWEPIPAQQDSAQSDAEKLNICSSRDENTVSTSELTAKTPVQDQWILKKATLLKKHLHRWPTINRDFQDASENGLSAAAKAPIFGEWFESKALGWAEKKGKLLSSEQQDNALAKNFWPSTIHRIKG